LIFWLEDEEGGVSLAVVYFRVGMPGVGELPVPWVALVVVREAEGPEGVPGAEEIGAVAPGLPGTEPVPLEVPGVGL